MNSHLFQDNRKELLCELLTTAIRSSSPESLLPQWLQRLELPRSRSITVIGVGKAAARMARSVEDHFLDTGIELSGTVVTPFGHGMLCENIRVLEASHPLPDASSIQASAMVLRQVRNASIGELVLCLLSGGGSSLLCAPPPGVTLEDKVDLNKRLLVSGATIEEINVVRRHVSLVKGGRLAKASQVPIVTFAISDVPGDSPATIASGPTVGDLTTRFEAQEILKSYGIQAKPSIETWLAKDACEPVRPQELPESEFHVVASGRIAIESAAAKAREFGLDVRILGDSIQGDAAEVARSHAKAVREIVADRKSLAMPLLLLSGGETTVQVKGNGQGGRNVHFLASLAQELGGISGVYALAADTDGTDGTLPIAGAIIDPSTLSRSETLGLSLPEFLRNNDTHTFFGKLGDSVVTGHTGTNVNDFRSILIEPC